MDVFRLCRRLVDDYGSYVSSFIRTKDERIEEEVISSLGEGLLWPDPLIHLNPSFEAGKTIDHAEPRAGRSVASGSRPHPCRGGAPRVLRTALNASPGGGEDIRIPIAELV
jgi:hypothetical protein